MPLVAVAIMAQFTSAQASGPRADQSVLPLRIPRRARRSAPNKSEILSMHVFW